MDKRLDQLKTLLRGRAVRFGDFQLASGKRSDVYVDGRLLTLSSDGAGLAAELLFERIVPLRPDAIGGMTLGADPIVGAILAHASRAGVPLSGFLVRKAAKGHGAGKRVEGPRPDAARPRVVVLDDTMTTGGSTLDALRCVREEWGAEAVLALCIVDREEGAREAFAAQGIPFDALVRLSDLR